jgi:CheY-like chemotaxis protein
MKSLQGLRVLLVSAQPNDHDHLGIWLRSEGAELHTGDWSALVATVERVSPSVLVADLQHERAAAEQALLQLQASAEHGSLPVVALVSDAAPGGIDPVSAPRVNKFIRAPAHPSDVVSALAGLGAPPPPAPEPTHAEQFAALVQNKAERRDLRGLLALLNMTGPFRYTAILRFDAGERLTSLWTFDREDPATDSFPTDKTVEASYCQRVLESNAPFEMSDAALDPTVQDHPARHLVLSYCGVPLHAADGSVFGTLCQFDVVPRFFQPSTRERLLDAANALRAHVHAMSPRVDAQDGAASSTRAER